jgi:hypothetical protein
MHLYAITEIFRRSTALMLHSFASTEGRMLELLSAQHLESKQPVIPLISKRHEQVVLVRSMYLFASIVILWPLGIHDTDSSEAPRNQFDHFTGAMIFF